MRLKRKNRKRLMKKKDDSEDYHTEVLSQEEITQLLNAINAGDDEPDDFRPAADSRKIKIYDFKRPDKFSKDQIRTVSILHETFSRLTTTYLSTKLKCPVHVHVASVDQLTYEEFIRSIPTPTTLGIINPDPLPYAWILEIDPAIAFSILNILLGGHPDNAIKQQHELTDLEIVVMSSIINRMLEDMKETWSSILDFKPKLSYIDTNPQFAQVVSPVEMVVLITIETKIADVEGMMNVCIPYLSIEPIMNRLSVEYWYSKVLFNNRPLKKIKVDLGDVDTVVRAEVLRCECSLKDVQNFKKGSLIKIDANSPTLSRLFAGDTVIGTFRVEKGNTLTPPINKYIRIIKLENYMEKNFMQEKQNVKYSTGNLGDIRIQLIVELGRTSKTLKDVERFGEGTILELESLAGEPCKIFANNVLIAKGEVVVIDENFGVRFVEMADENDKETEETVKEKDY